MGRLITTDAFCNITQLRETVETFNYEAWNAEQNALLDKQERYIARTNKQLIAHQQKLIALKAEYAALKEAYFKTLNDRRLKQSTRESRCDDIVNAMITIEDILCI